jgi:hypothetical protein
MRFTIDWRPLHGRVLGGALAPPKTPLPISRVVRFDWETWGLAGGAVELTARGRGFQLAARATRPVARAYSESGTGTA